MMSWESIVMELINKQEDMKLEDKIPITNRVYEILIENKNSVKRYIKLYVTADVRIEHLKNASGITRLKNHPNTIKMFKTFDRWKKEVHVKNKILYQYVLKYNLIKTNILLNRRELYDLILGKIIWKDLLGVACKKSKRYHGNIRCRYHKDINCKRYITFRCGANALPRDMVKAIWWYCY